MAHIAMLNFYALIDYLHKFISMFRPTDCSGLPVSGRVFPVVRWDAPPDHVV